MDIIVNELKNTINTKMFLRKKLSQILHTNILRSEIILKQKIKC